MSVHLPACSPSVSWHPLPLPFSYHRISQLPCGFVIQGKTKTRRKHRDKKSSLGRDASPFLPPKEINPPFPSYPCLSASALEREPQAFPPRKDITTMASPETRHRHSDSSRVMPAAGDQKSLCGRPRPRLSFVLFSRLIFCPMFLPVHLAVHAVCLHSRLVLKKNGG